MALKIFIDTNIYLRFYDSRQDDFKKLLTTLTKLKEYLIITRQVVDEVGRNKHSVFEQSFSNYMKQSEGFSDIQLPSHLEDTESGKIEIWNTKRREIKTLLETSNKNLKLIFDSLKDLMINGKDEVSIELERLFDKRIVETDQEFQLAKKRWQRGNPPGKASDSLGDQINWEQIISMAKDLTDLLIISNDGDFFVKGSTGLSLNPVLSEELRAASPGIRVKCFNKLSLALKEIRNVAGVKQVTFPNPKVIELISKQEEEPSVEQYAPTVFYKRNHQVIDGLTRLNYLYKHAMIGLKELEERLKGLGIPEYKIIDIIAQGYINLSEFEDFS